MTGIADNNESLVLNLNLPTAVDMTEGLDLVRCVLMHLPGVPNFVKGWEKNAKQQAGPRVCNLSASMDPHRLAEVCCHVETTPCVARWSFLQFACTTLTAKSISHISRLQWI